MSSAEILNRLREAAQGQCAEVRDVVVPIIDRAAPAGVSRIDLELHILIKAMMSNCVDALSFFVQQGVDIDSRDRGGCTLLMHACSFNMPGMAKKILALGASVDAVCNMGLSAAMYTARSGYADCLPPLMACGADLDRSSLDGRRALMLAAETEDPSCLNSLLQAGVDIDARDSFGRTALFYACHRGILCTAATLLEHGADVSGITPKALFEYGNPSMHAQSCLALIAAHEARRAAHEAITQMEAAPSP